MDLEHKKVYCGLVARLLVADEEVTDAEHDFLERLMDRFGLSEEDKHQVVEQMDTSGELGAEIRKLPEDDRVALLLELRNAAMADDAFGPKELELIEAVEKALEA